MLWSGPMKGSWDASLMVPLDGSLIRTLKRYPHSKNKNKEKDKRNETKQTKNSSKLIPLQIGVESANARLPTKQQSQQLLIAQHHISPVAVPPITFDKVIHHPFLIHFNIVVIIIIISLSLYHYHYIIIIIIIIMIGIVVNFTLSATSPLSEREASALLP